MMTKIAKQAQTEMMEKKKVAVLLELKPIVVEIEVDKNATDKEIVSLAKEQALIDMGTMFPAFTYTIAYGKALTFNKVKLGLVVKRPSDEEKGIVIKINPKTILVAFPGRKVLQGPPSAFELVDEKVNIEKIMWKRDKRERELNFWFEGHTGFFVNGSEIIPVAIGTTTRGKTMVIPINQKGSYYSLNDDKMKLIFDTKKEAKDYLENRLG